MVSNSTHICTVYTSKTVTERFEFVFLAFGLAKCGKFDSVKFEDPDHASQQVIDFNGGSFKNA